MRSEAEIQEAHDRVVLATSAAYGVGVGVGVGHPITLTNRA